METPSEERELTPTEELNEPCTCGSGKPFSDCHGEVSALEEEEPEIS